MSEKCTQIEPRRIMSDDLFGIIQVQREIKSMLNKSLEKINGIIALTEENVKEPNCHEESIKVISDLSQENANLANTLESLLE